MSAERQLLVDLSELMRTDARTGIQRVTRNVLQALLQQPPAGMRVAPVYDAGGYYAYVPPSLLDDGVFGAPPQEDEDPIHVGAGDIFFGLDFAPEQVPRNAAVLQGLKRHGVAMYFLVHDLLPLTHPEWFFDGADTWFACWLDHVSLLADGIVCDSRTTADELLERLEHHAPRRSSPLRLGYAHLGADLPVVSTSGASLPPPLTAAMAARPTFLMVGTLEPRKMHRQVLHAHELLWQRGIEVNLIIVGKAGWNVDVVAAELDKHGELNHRLFWLKSADDAVLSLLYREASALLAASAGEGFGLPLIEAAQHGLPVIARDLQVFNEVGGEHAFFFKADDESQLAEVLVQWLALHAQGIAPASSAMPRLTWAESTRAMLENIIDQHWYATSVIRLH